MRVQVRCPRLTSRVMVAALTSRYSATSFRLKRVGRRVMSAMVFAFKRADVGHRLICFRPPPSRRRELCPDPPKVAANHPIRQCREKPNKAISLERRAAEVADIFRDQGPVWREDNRGHISIGQLKVMSAIERCRTAALGGHVMRCDSCERIEISMTLQTPEFIRRFLIHVLPKGLHRIRQYRLFANPRRVDNLQHARVPLSVHSKDVSSTNTEPGDDSTRHLYPCPACGAPMLIIETFEHQHAPRAPPSIRLVNRS